MTCPSKSGVYLLEIKNKCGYCNFVILAESEALPFSVKYTFFSGHVPVMSQETASIMTRQQGSSQGTQTKKIYITSPENKTLGSTLSHTFDYQVPVPLY